MEGNDVGQEITLASDVVKTQLGALEDLLTDLDQHFGPMQGAQQRQGPGTWTAISACEQFGSVYAGALGQLESSLTSIREAISTAMITLRANATDLENSDQENRDRFSALAKRLADGAPTPTIAFQGANSSMFGSEAPIAAKATQTEPRSGASTGSGGAGWS